MTHMRRGLGIAFFCVAIIPLLALSTAEACLLYMLGARRAAAYVNAFGQMIIDVGENIYYMERERGVRPERRTTQ